jgi:phage terminase large subunit
MLSKNTLFISKRCTNLIREMESYRYIKDKTGVNPEERPVKQDDHLLDAARYALYMTRVYGVSTSVGWIRKQLWSFNDV